MDCHFEKFYLLSRLENYFDFIKKGFEKFPDINLPNKVSIFLKFRPGIKIPKRKFPDSNLKCFDQNPLCFLVSGAAHQDIKRQTIFPSISNIKIRKAFVQKHPTPISKYQTKEISWPPAPISKFRVGIVINSPWRGFTVIILLNIIFYEQNKSFQPIVSINKEWHQKQIFEADQNLKSKIHK